MTKADYIQMAIEARTPFNEVIETAKRFEEYCGMPPDVGFGYSGRVFKIFEAYRDGDVIADANDHRYVLRAL